MNQDGKPGRGSEPSRRNRRSVARLAAVQALYQTDLTGVAPEKVIAEFRSHRLEEIGPKGADAEFFGELVGGVVARRAEIDGLLAPLLAEGWTIERLETVLRAILRSGAFELLARGDVPTAVVIDEYVRIAHAFFSEREPGVVNGILDRLARAIRATEFEDRPRARQDAPDR